jgi:hypothetical protein
VAIKGRLFGTVNAVTPNNLSLTNKGNIYNVELTPETRYEGRIVPGAFVEVDVIQLANGHLVAKKVEVEDEEEEEDSEDGDHDDQSVTPTSSPSLPSGGNQPSNTPVPAVTPAGGDDDHENGEEHDEDGPEAPEATEQPEDHSDEDAEDEEHEDSEHEEDEEDH